MPVDLCILLDDPYYFLMHNKHYFDIEGCIYHDSDFSLRTMYEKATPISHSHRLKNIECELLLLLRAQQHIIHSLPTAKYRLWVDIDKKAIAERKIEYDVIYEVGRNSEGILPPGMKGIDDVCNSILNKTLKLKIIINIDSYGLISANSFIYNYFETKISKIILGLKKNVLTPKATTNSLTTYKLPEIFCDIDIEYPLNVTSYKSASDIAEYVNLFFTRETEKVTSRIIKMAQISFTHSVKVINKRDIKQNRIAEKLNNCLSCDLHRRDHLCMHPRISSLKDRDKVVYAPYNKPTWCPKMNY